MALQAPHEDYETNSRRNRIDLTTNHEQACALASEWVSKLEASRKRKFSEAQWNSCYKTVLCLCLDLFSAAYTEPPVWIGYSRGKENFKSGGAYWDHARNKAALSCTFYLEAIDYFEKEGLLINHVAEPDYSQFSSRMQATPVLVKEFAKRGLNWIHIIEDADLDNIIVKDENKKPTSWPDPKDFPLESALKNLRRINDNLQRTFINISISDKQLDDLNASADSVDENEETDHSIRGKVDFTNRKVRRIFSKSSFQIGGRFYGGWWQSVPGRLRKFIEINGWATVELDYSTIQPRILYASVGKHPPPDSYVLPGWDKEIRPIVKKAFSQLLNSDPTSKNPKQWHRFAPDLDPDPFPDNWYKYKKHQKAEIRRLAFHEVTGRHYSELITDLLEFHGPIESKFFSSVWEVTQSIDATVVEKVLLKLLDRDYPETVLPIHDSFIVRYGR